MVSRPTYSGVLRCPPCNRLTLARSRRCTRCGALQNFAYVRNDRAENRVDAASIVGVSVAVCIVFGSVLLWFEQPRIALVVGWSGVLLAASHVLLRWFRSAWTWSLLSWVVMVVVSLYFLRNEIALAVAAAGTSLAGLLFTQVLYRSLVRYLDGEEMESGVELPSDERQGQCEQCTERAPRATAPVWCVSFLIMTSVTIGRPRFLCITHARINALPATIFSALFGWWGFPWGVVRTPEALWQNTTNGGVDVDSETARSLYARERDGESAWFNFFPGVRSKPIAILGLLLFLFLVLGSVWITLTS